MDVISGCIITDVIAFLSFWHVRPLCMCLVFMTFRIQLRLQWLCARCRATSHISFLRVTAAIYFTTRANTGPTTAMTNT